MSNADGRQLSRFDKWRNFAIAAILTSYGAVYLALKLPSADVAWPVAIMAGGWFVTARVVARPTRAATLSDLVKLYFGTASPSRAAEFKRALLFVIFAQVLLTVGAILCLPNLVFGDPTHRSGFFTVAMVHAIGACVLYLGAVIAFFSALRRPRVTTDA